MKRIYLLVFIALSLFFISLGLIIFFSPYGKGELYDNRFLKSSVTISMSKDSVYNVLGNSENARKWSVFVHHINTVNSSQIMDGTVGSIRRCYQNKDESGLRWDEEVIINKKNRTRRLSIFNMIHFDMSADYLMTDQIYEDIEDGCKLTFTLFFVVSKDIPFMDEIKMYFAAYAIEDIFQKNLINIKHLVEEGVYYQRVHSF